MDLKQSPRAWLEDRIANADYLAARKSGTDRDGWREDAAYLRAILAMMPLVPGYPTPPYTPGDDATVELAGRVGQKAIDANWCARQASALNSLGRENEKREAFVEAANAIRSMETE